MVRIDAIFFDVDGTLVDARNDIVDAVNHVLRRLGFPEKPFEEIVSYIGTGVKDLIAKSLDSSDKEIIEKATAIYGEYYLRHPADRARLYPHTREMLEYFGTKRKFILTNRYAIFADSVLKALGIREYFEDIIGGDDESCLKPSACALDPHILKLGLNKDRALIVGDMAIDIETGKNSGVRTCWVRHGLGTAAEVEPLKPDFIISDLIELTKLIN